MVVGKFHRRYAENAEGAQRVESALRFLSRLGGEDKLLRRKRQDLASTVAFLSSLPHPTIAPLAAVATDLSMT